MVFKPLIEMPKADTTPLAAGLDTEPQKQSVTFLGLMTVEDEGKNCNKMHSLLCSKRI
jgi:hypothetical protein